VATTLRKTRSGRKPRRTVPPLLREALVRLAADPALRDRVPRDAVAVPRRYARDRGREVVALLAALFAFGRVASFQSFLDALLVRLGPSPDQGLSGVGEEDLMRLARGLRYRWVGESDVGCLLVGIRRTLLEDGSLEGAFGRAPRGSADDYGEELSFLVGRLARGWDGRIGRSGRHLLADPSRGSSSKRLCLFLRWMVRPDDGVDLGLWTGLETRRLVVPLDTHVHRVGLRTGLVRRKSATWSTARELTGALREVDPEDPVRLDFALCHLGMSGRCPARTTADGCSSCPLLPGCPTGKRRIRSKRAGRTDLLSDLG